MTALSILELARVTEGSDARAALHNARDLAAQAEGWGYRRLWVAEHHNTPAIASAATAVALAHIARRTSTLPAGAGALLPPTHTPSIGPPHIHTPHPLLPRP